ncbi:MAG TPA: ABC transporter permease subunit, partial [Armatimonadota bacterium]|nr:ABC transporter permease subunit [Armatimonadota bacterium]
MKSLYSTTNILFILIITCLILPSSRPFPWYLLTLVVVIRVITLLRPILSGSDKDRTITGDISAIVYGVLLAWYLATTRFPVMDKFLFPQPEAVLALFVSELPDMLKGLVNSLILLVSGYLLALVTAVPLGLVIGWRRRLFHAINPFTKVLGPIPPTVYIPYAIALLPTFRLASIFVIFVGAFWPLLINTINGVFNIEKTLIDSALVLRLKERTMLVRIILPGALPSIAAGATLALVFSFILLTAAELIGATSGVGWYVKNFADFADYPRVVVGILFIGLVVT